MSAEVHTIPSLGFARGSVVREGKAGMNALVVRCFGERTAIVRCEGDDDGQLRLRDLPTSSLVEIVPPRTDDDLGERIAELEALFDMRWQADMRAIIRWQQETGEILTLPDHADLVIWLLGKIEASAPGDETQGGKPDGQA